jgi:uncharacterized membrane protein
VNKLLDEDQQNECLRCFAIGHEKDQAHDIIFLSEEVVEIIARALSPGTNAPFVAMTAIDWLQVMIESLSKRKIVDPCLYDNKNQLRIICEGITVEYFVDNVFGKARSYISHDRNALLHILNSISMMLANSTNEKLSYLLKLHAEKFLAASNENLSSNEDKHEAQEAFTKFMRINSPSQ